MRITASIYIIIPYDQDMKIPIKEMPFLAVVTDVGVSGSFDDSAKSGNGTGNTGNVSPGRAFTRGKPLKSDTEISRMAERWFGYFTYFCLTSPPIFSVVLFLFQIQQACQKGSRGQFIAPGNGDIPTSPASESPQLGNEFVRPSPSSILSPLPRA